MWATPRASRRATFPRFMPLAPPAARLSRACEPLDARDHPSVTRWLSRQNRGSVAADRGSREETCTSQPFAPRGPAEVVAAGLSGGEDVKFDYKKYVHNMMVGKPLVSMRV